MSNSAATYDLAMKNFGCPKCDGEQLHYAEGSGRVAQCSKCGGMFVPRGANAPSAADAASQPLPDANDAKGGRCPNDQSILSRASIDLASGQTIHLERCSSCHGTWFDAGEWQALAHDHLLDSIDEFWTPEYRARHRHEHDARQADARDRAAFGDLYDELNALAAKLRNNPRRSQALAFLRERSNA